MLRPVNIRLAAGTQAHGQIVGLVTSVDPQRLEFHLQHRLYRAVCTFPPSLLPEVQAAAGRRVAVRGSLTYAGNFPERADITHLRALPDRAELPSLLDLAGTITIPGGQESVAFVRALRDAGE